MLIVQLPLWPDKVCQKCGVSKPISEFYPNPKYSDGLWTICKECSRLHAREWRRQHAELNRERSRAYHREHPETLRNWVARNPEKVKESHQRSRTKRLAKYAAYARIRSHRQNKNGGSFTQVEWDALCAEYDYCCVACGKRRKLTVDHVIPVTKGGTSDIANIQPLCGPCNSRKGNRTIDYREPQPNV